MPVDISSFNDVRAIFGFFTDLHNADKNTSSNRYYRDAPEKLEVAIAEFNSRDLSFVICGGDLIDQGGQTGAEALTRLTEIETIYAEATADRFYVLGNHDMDALSKTQFYANTAMTQGYYSFDRDGIHFIVLDANYRSDSDTNHYNAGNYTWTAAYIPPNERTWLTNDLASTQLPVVVFCHQRLVPTGDSHHVANASTVRGILEASGKVIGVFTGHRHQNNLTTINGITYHNMMAMTEGAFPDNAFGIVTITNDLRVVIEGFGSQESYPA